jgi:hypothetical protein
MDWPRQRHETSRMLKSGLEGWAPGGLEGLPLKRGWKACR